MRTATLPVGFIPLVDAAPLIVAQEMGFAAQEGIALDLRRAPSWSSLRDMLSFGQVDAAHMLSTVPVAMAMGLGGVGTRLAAVAVTSVNGNVIGVKRALEQSLIDAGYAFDFQDAYAAGRALLQVSQKPLRIGVPFPFSMHAELVFYWLAGLQPVLDGQVEIRTVPPPLMADAIEAGEIDAFCVGEPWGSRAVDKGLGALLLPGTAIWNFAPEKVLAVRQDWAETERALLDRLIRAVWRAARWLSQPDAVTLASEILSRPAFLDLPPEMLERALTGRLTINAAGAERHTEQFLEFARGAANFPWRSQAEWIGQHLARRTGLDEAAARTAARTVFRSDLFRAALSGTSADLPGASSKVEGALEGDTAVASAAGRVILCRDRFFDGRVFEPGA
ncbi:CmpA/NrtA family ABC transporter substrate-binding protein [uncultured Roseobacter sp.]|uniref:CmpA/NrtA family ABC transporter substrate-binding protein n=1 Tax=uncultured Roseobacter sp. TaxID=114847 RepID=UPI002635FAAC|nr:CmpA/NrtA family ABC transporter substrate-binding protein [uncultured Roseobacter sp.]